MAFAAGMLTLLLAMPVKAAGPTAVGLWEQSDDNGRVGGWFLIYENGKVFEGALAKMFPKPGEDPNPICKKCKGDQKNAPSLGLVMIKGMQRDGLSYENGTILDPRDGTIYKARMEVSPDGNELTVRGYLGIPLFGKSQIWKRIPDENLLPEETPENLLPFLPALAKQE
ncbi:MAG: DUF2147 domain-containing protein [Bauldia sp.]